MNPPEDNPILKTYYNVLPEVYPKRSRDRIGRKHNACELFDYQSYKCGNLHFELRFL